MRACIVQGSQQIWVAALWYWGNSLNGREDGYVPPWWVLLAVWPLAAMSFVFAYLMLYGLPGRVLYDILSTHTELPNRVLPPDTTKGASLPENSFPTEACAMVPCL